MKPKEFYVYTYVDPRNDEPFYVGKGFGFRYKRHLKPYASNKHVKNRIKAIRLAGFEPNIVRFYTFSEREAFDLECALISAYGRRDLGTGSLCNYTNGGDGCSGRVGMKHSQETKDRIRKALSSRRLTEEHKAAISQANRGRKSTQTPESLEKMRVARSSPEYRKRMRELGKQVMTPEHQEKMQAAMRAKKEAKNNES